MQQNYKKVHIINGFAAFTLSKLYVDLLKREFGKIIGIIVKAYINFLV